MNINLDEYDLINPDSVDIVQNETNEYFYDIEVEIDNSFHIVDNDKKMYLVHNCDGYHIKGLIMNLFDYFWPELLEMDFLYEFVTPILSVKQGKKRDFFYNKADYDKWLIKNPNTTAIVKYYKGLGTLEADVTKMLFSDIDKHLIKFHYDKPEYTKNLIDMVFKNQRSDERKTWLLNYKIDNFVNKFGTKTTYDSFMDNEFIEFSMADNIRSIPSMIDGLKPSQRKILYTMFKVGNKSEINVSELFGYVKAHTAYHHGSQSLDDGIVKLAQDFIGSNNISLLMPIGGFGTRLSGGDDCAAGRYINTTLRNITSDIFMSVDNNILDYKIDDSKSGLDKSVEPYFYTPIIPVILLNGAEGIGTGWKTFIPKYKAEDLILYIENILNDKRKNIDLDIFYEKFDGQIVKNDELNYTTYGIITKINTSTVNITELPIGVWNDNYYLVLNKMLEDKIIKSYTKDCTDTKVDIKIKMSRESLDVLSNDDLIRMFKLSSKISLNNMHLFDYDGKIKKYQSPYEIIDDYYKVRLYYYSKRKEFKLGNLNSKRVKCENLIEFIRLVLNKKIVINNNTYNSIIESLEKYKLQKIDGSYDYLIKMPLIKMTKEELDSLNNDYTDITNEIKEISEITPEKMWLADLTELKKSLKKFRTESEVKKEKKK